MRKLSVRKTFISKIRDRIKETKKIHHKERANEFNGIFLSVKT